MIIFNTNLVSKYLRLSRFVALFIFGVMFTMSCTPKLSFLKSAVVPAARGTVRVKMDDNKNHTIDISLINLAEPGRLTPAKEMYMVWMETDKGIIKNLGQVTTDSGTFSKTLKADFKTVSSFTPVKIFITVEDDANVQMPASEIILTTERF